jgi:ADP-ribose pyrophosphatase
VGVSSARESAGDGFKGAFEASSTSAAQSMSTRKPSHSGPLLTSPRRPGPRGGEGGKKLRWRTRARRPSCDADAVTSEVFKGRLIGVRIDERGREVVRHPPASVIVAVDDRRLVWLVRSPRPVAEGSLVEVPAGLVDPGESPEQAARRELHEECGVQAERWEELASAYSSPGYSDERIHVFLATELRQVGGEEPLGEIEGRLQAPIEEALELCSGNLQSLAALLLADRRLAAGGRLSHPG